MSSVLWLVSTLVSHADVCGDYLTFSQLRRRIRYLHVLHRADVGEDVRVEAIAVIHLILAKKTAAPSLERQEQGYDFIDPASTTC